MWKSVEQYQFKGSVLKAHKFPTSYYFQLHISNANAAIPPGTAPMYTIGNLRYSLGLQLCISLGLAVLHDSSLMFFFL